jgi:type I restriction enzyme, S subunit
MSSLENELPTGWSRKRLGEICRESRTIAPSGNRLRYLGLENIESGTGRILNWASDDKTQAGISTTFSFDTSHVLYGKLRPYLNKVALPESRGRCSTEIIPLAPAEGVDREFLAHLLRLDAITAAAMKGVTGARMPRANMRELLAVMVPVPPFPEQQRIARKLREQFGELDRVRKALADQIDAAEKLSTATLRAAFQEAESAKWPLHKLEALDSTRVGIVDGPFGSNLKTEHYRAKGPRVVRLQNIGVMDFIGHHKAFIAPEHYQSLLYHAVAPGDVVVAALGDGARPAGRACRVPADFGEGIVKADCFRVRLPESIIDPDFLVYFFNSPATLKDVAESMRGATRPRVTLGMLKTRRIPVPDLSTQTRIARDLSEKLSVTRVLKTQLSAQLAALDRYPAALLCDAFAGRL